MEEVPRPEVLESTNLFFWVSLNEQNLDHKLYAWCSRCTKVGYIEHLTLPIGGDKTDMYTRVLRSGLQRFCDAQAYVAAPPTHAGARLLGFQARTMHIKKKGFFCVAYRCSVTRQPRLQLDLRLTCGNVPEIGTLSEDEDEQGHAV